MRLRWYLLHVARKRQRKKKQNEFVRSWARSSATSAPRALVWDAQFICCIFARTLPKIRLSFLYNATILEINFFVFATGWAAERRAARREFCRECEDRCYSVLCQNDLLIKCRLLLLSNGYSLLCDTQSHVTISFALAAWTHFINDSDSLHSLSHNSRFICMFQFIVEIAKCT